MQQWYFLSLWCGDRWEAWWRFHVSCSASPDTLLGTGTYEVPSKAVITAVTGTPNVTVSSQTTSVTITHYSSTPTIPEWMHRQRTGDLRKGQGSEYSPFPEEQQSCFEGKQKDFLTAVSGTQGPCLQWKSWNVSTLRWTQAAFTAHINKMNNLCVFQNEMYIILIFRRQKNL